MNRILISVLLAAGLVLGCKSGKNEGTTESTIATSELPLAVSNAFAKDHPGVAPTKVVKETYKDGTIHYEIEYRDAEGKEHDTEYNVAGDELEDH